MLFTSDNWAPVHPAIMQAMVDANLGVAPAYGGDDLTDKVKQRFNEIFETETEVFFVTTGGAANGLALSALVPPYGATLCHEISHIQMDEAGLPELYTGGAKLLPLSGASGKLTQKSISEVMHVYGAPVAHHVRPRAISVTQATEYGTTYSPNEMRGLSHAAKEYGLKMHMDGARFSNAVAALGCAPADITWRVGVDVLSFGATKNGAMVAEAVVFFDKALAHEFVWRQKRAGHVWSKARFLAAQWDAFLSDRLWLNLAKKANTAAKKLSDGLAALDGVTIHQPTQINEVFASFSDEMTQHLREQGAQFYDWVYPGDQWNGKLKRLVTSYATTDEEVAAFIAAAKNL